MRLPRPRSLVRTVHLWSTLVLGLWLLLVTTTGAIALYAPEGNRYVSNSELFQKSSGEITLAEALASFRAAEPDLVAIDAYRTHGGNVVVAVAEPVEGEYYLDGGNGAVLGFKEYDAGFWSWIGHLHADPLGTFGVGEWEIPVLGWGQVETMVGGSALLLLLMLASGIVLWWPGLMRVGRRLRTLRLRRTGWYIRSYDLHNVLGVAAIPFLLMWAVTGANFYFYEEVKPVWYALTPGSERVSEPPPSKATTPDVTPARALAAIERAIPDGARVVSLAPPDSEDPAATYFSYVAYGSDPWEYGNYPGNHSLTVHRKTGEVLTNDIADPPSTAQWAFENWWGTIHFGNPVNPLWRIVWFLFGIAPLALAVTGIVQWWLKRRQRRALKARRGVAEAASA